MNSIVPSPLAPPPPRTPSPFIQAITDKSVVALLISLALFAALFLHFATWDQISNPLMATIIGVFGAQGLEKLGLHIGSGIANRPPSTTQTTMVQAETATTTTEEKK